MKRSLKFLASLLVTLFFCYLAFRGTNWRALWDSVRTANYLWVLPYMAILGAIHVCRALRWGSLLSRMERISFKTLNEAAAIGFMMLIVLPFRLGEFARPLLIAQRTTIRRSAAMTSVVLERIVDGLMVASLMRLLLFFVEDNGSKSLAYVKFGANVMFAVFGGGLAFLLFALWQHARAVRLMKAVFSRFSPALAEKIAYVVDGFVGALREFPRGRQLVLFFALTFAYWGLNGFGMHILARAFEGTGQPLGLSLFEAYVVMCMLVVGVMIPAAPGMVGTFQWAVTLGLAVFVPAAAVKSTGLAYANVLWLVQTGQQVLYGLVMLSVSHLSFRDLAGKLNKESQGGGGNAVSLV